MPPRTKSKSKDRPTVKDMQSENPVAAAKTFGEIEADDNTDVASRYAVEENDVSNFRGVSEEYRTYASEVDSPQDFDGTVPDNSQEKLDALAEDDSDDDTDDNRDQGNAPGQSGGMPMGSGNGS